MKKLFASAVLVALTITSNAVSAQNLTTAATHVNDDTTLKLKIDEIKPLQFKVLVLTPSNQKLNIIVEDQAHTVLFEDYSPKVNGYVKVFDFSSLPDGTYTFIINGKKETLSKSFEISSKTSRFTRLAFLD